MKVSIIQSERSGMKTMPYGIIYIGVAWLLTYVSVRQMVSNDVHPPPRY